MAMYSSGSSSRRIHIGTSEFTKHAAINILKFASKLAPLRNDYAVRPLLNELNIKGYNTIKQMVHKTFPNCNINRIHLVHAPQMYGMYMLRQEEMKLVVGRSVQEKLMFHVTTESRAMEALDSGLDWRRTRRNKFGQGVSFSDDADYANYYADKFTNEEKRVIMICTVLVSETYVVPRQGDGNSLIVPPAGADTTVSNNNRVYVKYNDNEFYPLYFVHYRNRPEHLTNSKYFHANSRRAMGRYGGRTTEEMCSDHLEATGYYDDDDALEQMCSDHLEATGYYDDDDALEQMCSDHLEATGYYDDDDALEQMCSDFYDDMRIYYEENDD